MLIVAGQDTSHAEQLVAALDRHPEVAIVPEDALLALAFLRQRVSDPDTGRRLAADLIVASSGFADGLGRHLDAAAVRDAVAAAPYHLAGITAAVHDAYAAAAGVRQAGFRLAVLNSPVLNRSGLWNPEARVVHVVRDVRRIVADGVPDEAKAVRNWDVGNRAFHDRVGAGPAHYLLVRHEDLPAEADRVAAFLDLTQPIEGLPPAPTGRPARVDGGREGLYAFGYDPPRRSLRRQARRAARLARRVATEVGARMARARDRSWSRRAPSPWAPAAATDEVAPAWCNVCRWSGPGFDGPADPTSGRCPRCGATAGRRFLVRCLTERIHDGAAVHEVGPPEDPGWRRFAGSWTGDRPADAVLSSMHLQRAADPGAALEELRAAVRPGGRLLLQVPVVVGEETVALPASEANPMAEHWQFGLDLVDRMEAVGFSVTVLTTAGMEVAADDPVVDLDALRSGLRDRPTASVASTALARRCGFEPPGRFLVLEGRVE